MKVPKISIITVCFNAEHCIEDTILSVLNQDYSNFEYIIIDGNSTDGTIDIIEKYRSKILFVSEPDRGIYDAMNKGICLATGEWIHFRNAGDLFYSFHTLSELFQESVPQDVSILHGDCLYRNSWGTKVMTPSICNSDYRVGMPVIHPSSFVRASLHKRCPFDISFKSSGDYAFMWQCLKSGERFEYRPIVVSIFPIEGFAMRNWKVTVLEDCRIEGYDSSIPWSIRLSYRLFISWVKTLYFTSAKKNYVLGKIRKYQLKSKGWIENEV